MAFHSSLKNKLKDYFSSIKFSDLLLNFCIWFIGIIVGLIPFIFKFIISHDGIIAAKDFWERFEIPFAFISSAIILCVEITINCLFHANNKNTFVFLLFFWEVFLLVIYMFFCSLNTSEKEYVLTNLSGGIALWIINVGISSFVSTVSLMLIICQPVNIKKQNNPSEESKPIKVTINSIKNNK